MTLAYGWIIKTQKRISDALVSGQLTKWEMNFIQTIDIKLETYKTDSNISHNQHRQLFTILTKAECPKICIAHPDRPFRSPFEPPSRLPFSTSAHDNQDGVDPEDSDYREDGGYREDSDFREDRDDRDDDGPTISF
jgi:hypothetical protein